MAEERRLVTVLFGDVVGSTSLGETLDPEDLRRLLARFLDIARDVVAEHGGTLEKFIGDAAMAIFGLAQAHDDDARRALDAALDLRERLRADPVLGKRLPIRIGVNTGEVVANRDPQRTDFIVTGDAVNVAARLQQAAEPWQIVASGRTVSADLGAHDFASPAQMALKGKRSTVEARVLIGRSISQRPSSRLVGRAADMAQLELIARRAFSEHRPYLVSLLAPAGTGKSRLVEEFLAGLAETAPEARIVVAQCLPYGQRLTYWPMRALLFGIIGLDDEASPEAARLAIRRWLEEADAAHPAETADLLAATIGASDADAVDRAPLFSAWRETLELAASQRPLVLLIEDLHWSSDSLLDLVEFILQPRGEGAMVMIALSRPELLERRPTWGGGRRNHLSMALEPLDDASIAELVNGLLAQPAGELVPIVVRRSEGNPFYAGEIVRSLLERGVDLRDADAVVAAAHGLPDTVQATVLARLDLLPHVPRRVLQLGSVLGRSFTDEGVRSIGAEDDDLPSAIDLLIDRELLRPSGRGELTFRHIIIREVAYGMLPRSERATLHAAAARWLERQAADREDELAELVAFHYREAVVLAASFVEPDDEALAAAVRWLRRAAEVAANARGMTEAVGHLRAAIDLAPSAEQAAIYQRLAEFYGSGDEAVQAHARAWQIGEREGLPADFLLHNLGSQLMVQLRWYASVAQPPSEAEVVELADHGAKWIDQAGPRSRAAFQIALGFRPFWLRQSAARPVTDVDFAHADGKVREGLALARELDDATLVSAALDAMTATPVIDWRRTLELSRRRTAMGERLPLNERLDALGMVAWSSVLLGELPEAIEAAEHAISLVQPGQNAGFALAGASWNAYARALRGDWDEMRGSVEGLRQRWLEAERPAAAYALQGLLSAVDWARTRGEEELLERWRSVADAIVNRFAEGHPVRANAAALDLDLDGLADIVLHHERYPDRAHYVEHALALCADRRHALPAAVLDSVLDRAVRSALRLIEAQARRLRGMLNDAPEELQMAMDIFADVGAGRYLARTELELGALSGSEEQLASGRRRLAALGEEDLFMAVHR